MKQVYIQQIESFFLYIFIIIQGKCMTVTKANCISLVFDVDPSFNLYSVGSTTKLSNSTSTPNIVSKVSYHLFYYFSFYPAI